MRGGNPSTGTRVGGAGVHPGYVQHGGSPHVSLAAQVLASGLVQGVFDGG